MSSSKSWKNESHGKYTPGKITEVGYNVRVKGVDKFDMVESYTDTAEVILRKFNLDPANADQYAAEFAALMLRSQKRSENDGCRLADEALRIHLINDEEAAAIKTLYHRFIHLGDHIGTYLTLNITEQFDYLRTLYVITGLISPDEFMRLFENNMNQIIAYILSRDNNSPDFEEIVNFCTDIPINWTAQLDTHINNYPPYEEFVNNLIRLSSVGIYTSMNIVANKVIALKNNSPEKAFEYLLSIIRNPDSTHEIRYIAGKTLSILAQQIPDPNQFNDKLAELKQSGRLTQILYDRITQTLQNRIREAQQGNDAQQEG